MDYGKVKRGFKKGRELLRKRGKYVADCNSCMYYYQGKEDTDEICHNAIVTKFDMVETPEKTFCTYWQPENDR